MEVNKIMSDLITNINSAVTDFTNIKQSIINMGVDLPENTPTSEYSMLIEGISNNQLDSLTTDNLVFSLSDIEFTTYNTKVLLGNPSIYNLPLGIIPKTAEIVSKCGTQSNFLFSYGNGGSGQTFSLTQDEFVGWYNSVSYADMNEARGKVRHIVCTNENKSVTIYVNGQKVVNTELSYPCDPNDADFSLNSFHGQPSLNTSGSALYVLRFYRKRLSESEVINNFKIFSQKYKIII